MRKKLYCVLVMTTLLLACDLPQGHAQGPKDDEVDNPYYKGWAGFKIGSKVVFKEHTVFGEGGTEEKTVEYELFKVTPNRVTVLTAVIEKSLLSIIETAPTKIIYPAKVSKAELKAALLDAEVKKGMETIKVLGKDLECSVFEITRKDKGSEISKKTWRSDTIPGGRVKSVHSTKQEGKLIATTTITLEFAREGPYVKGKDKDKDKD
jgi:hypothetical protein